MSDAAAILKLLLNPERSLPERIASLAALRPFLKEEKVVLQLAEAAPAEPSSELRRSLLGALVQVDPTRLKKRGVLIEALSIFAATETEPDLRRTAVERLAAVAPHEPDVEGILAATLEYDLEPSIQQAALTGLAAVARPSKGTAKALSAFARRAPRQLRNRLVGVLGKLDRAAAEEGWLALLEPWEDPAIAAQAMEALEGLPDLSKPAAAALMEMVRSSPREALRDRALALLADVRKMPAESLESVLELLAASPDRAHLAAIFRDRLGSVPGLADSVLSLLRKTRGVGIRRALLEVLGEWNDPAPWLEALKDPSPWVRTTAIEGAIRRFPAHPKEIGPALVEAARKEPVSELRMRLAQAFTDLRGADASTRAFVIGWLEAEKDPRIFGRLAVAATQVPVTEENREAMLAAYRRILTEPTADPKAKDAVLDRLRAFAWQDHPTLVACLRALLERARDVETVDAVHKHYRKIAPDFGEFAELAWTLFLRFLHHYPREPLDGWMKEFRDLARQDDRYRARIPWLVRLTGATWAIDAASPEEQKSAFLDSMDKAMRGAGGYRAASNLLREAWEKRTLKKSDAVVVFRKVLMTSEDGVFGDLIRILKEGRLVTPELLDASFAYLARFPQGRHAYGVKDYLRSTASADPSYADRALAGFTQEAYLEYARIHGHPRDRKHPPRTWNDWEYQEWGLMYPDWPAIELVDPGKSGDRVLEVLGTKPERGVPGRLTIQMVILEHLWRGPSREWSEYQKRRPDQKAAELAAVAKLLENTRSAPELAELRDRAACLFAKRWEEYVRELKKTEPPWELRTAAAEAYAYQCTLHAKLGDGKSPFPKPLPAMDAKRLEELWPLSKEAWERIVREHLSTSTPEEEAEAAGILRQAQVAADRFRFEEAHGLLTRLLEEFRHTKLVREKAKSLEYSRAQYDPGAASPPEHEAKAEKMHALAVNLIEKGDRSEARAYLGELFQRYWRTAFVKERRKHLEGLLEKVS